MSIAQGAAESAFPPGVVVVLIAIASVLFWRIALKLLLIALVALVITGAAAVVEQISAIVK